MTSWPADTIARLPLAAFPPVTTDAVLGGAAIGVGLFIVEIVLIIAGCAWALVMQRRLSKGLRAGFLAELFTAAAVPFHPATLQPALFHLRPHRAALRFLAWSSVVRPTLLVVLLLLSPWALLNTAAIVVAWGELMSRRLPAQALSPGAVFVPIRVAHRGVLIEARSLVARYWPLLLSISVAAGVLLGGLYLEEPRVSPSLPSLPSAAWAVAGAVLGVALRVDLFAVAPLLVVGMLAGVPAAFLAPLAVGLEATSARTLRLACDYLSPAAMPVYRSTARLLVAASAVPGALW